MGKKKVKSKTTPIVQGPMNENLFGSPGTPATPAYTDPTTGVTTPGTPGTPGSGGFQGQIKNFLAMDPHQFVAPPSPLQQTAWSNAQNMGGWQPYMQQAMGMAQQAGQGPATTVGAYGYNPFQMGPAPQSGGVSLGNAPTMGWANAGAAPQFGGAKLGETPQATAARLAEFAQGTAGTIDPTVNAQASTADWQGILEGGGINQYMNPANEAYVNNTLASYDDASARTRAAQRAAQAGSRAFGGSRAGIEMGAFDASTGLNRATTESGLRTKAFGDATNIALSEVKRRQDLGTFNAGQQTDVSLANAAAENARRTKLGEFGQDMSKFNVSERNRQFETQGKWDQDTVMANLDMRGKWGLQQGDYDQATGLANQDWQGKFAQSEADRQQEAYRQNLAMQGQYGLKQGEMDLQNNQYNTGLQSQWGLQQGQYGNEAARYGAETQNAAAMENARLLEAMYGRQMEGAGLYGDLASQYGGELRNDLTLQGQLGEQQRGAYQEYLNAIPTQLQMGGQLYGQIPTGAYLGQSGTQTSSGGLVGDLLKAGVGGLAQGIGSGITFSDRRLKTDIERVGSLGPLGLYSFVKGKRRQVGVMADEVARHAPHALGPVIAGFATVDYSKLMEA